MQDGFDEMATLRGGPVRSRAAGFAGERAGAEYQDAAMKFFRPEFFNRMDAVVTFRPLLPASVKAIARRELDAIALSRESLGGVAAQIPGSRVLDGGFLNSSTAVAVPKGKPEALAYVSQFIEEEHTRTDGNRWIEIRQRGCAHNANSIRKLPIEVERQPRAHNGKCDE